MRTVSALIVALVLPVAAGARTTPSGLKGVVTRGPITPVCAAEQPCDEPARHVTLLFSRRGVTEGRAVTDDAGRYRIRLAAGLYSVRRAGSIAVDRGLHPKVARVYAGRVVRLNFTIDTGIR